MKKLIFATANPNKVREVNQLLAGKYLIESLADIGFTEEVPETTPTIEGNALQKVRYVHERIDKSCFSEDSGLEIDFLDGAPGVITAHYAGPERDANANMDLVLRQLGDTNNRGAQFRTVVALILDNREYTFEGIAKGSIAFQKSGSEGFGYDPIFIPDGYDISFAEMDKDTKNKISHRAIAVNKLIDFLRAS